ncbi:pentapeptide repeat-containing protein [Virgisporangium aliadipatigenens]|uniref:pentapeptide repeat-containing protein n=1 Tax=Virgisporangium aliadipatigenens TaxID=741659 RepID=UPI00194348BD|nr:pentapeptide repeat-containing protein [Virgisporangium aliadipatigenens]
MAIDHSGETLVDADLSGRVLDGADFADTRFHGTTRFAGATFAGGARFTRAVFHGDVDFTGARFEGEAEFGRVRFRGRADFTGAHFVDVAWFGRGTDTWWEDDEAWEGIEEIVPAPWDEPNEDDPQWPLAVLIEDYQDWEEGGDGARFRADASFRQVRFDGPAWFYNARFAAGAAFTGARFAERVQLDQPAVDLTGAAWAGGGEYGPSRWPLGWSVPAGGGDLTPDASVAPYAGRIADGTDLENLARLADERPELRQRVVQTLCAFLRVPVPFELRAGSRTAAQEALVALRKAAQEALAEQLRHTPDLNVWLCGATLVDLDLRGCAADFVDFSAAQFHGTTRLDGSRLKRARYSEDWSCGRATFHGDVVVDGEPPAHAVFHRAVLS